LRCAWQGVSLGALMSGATASRRADHLIALLEQGRLSEGDLYRIERLHRPALPAKVAPGVLVCPICGGSAMRFLPFGIGQRRNAVCPHCGSVERHRFLWLFLVRRTDLFRRRYRVLHTAPEPAIAARLSRRRNLHYRSVDRFDPRADIQADLRDLPLADGSVDVLLSSHVIEHIPDDRAALAELARIVRPGGWGVLMTPFDPNLPASLEDSSLDTPAARLRAYGHPFHYRVYGADLPDRLAEAGFSSEIVTTGALLSGHQRRRYRINRNNLLLLRRHRA
jgi:SAM-dependent methyltransferase